MTRLNAEYRLKIAFKQKSGSTLYEYVAFNE